MYQRKNGRDFGPWSQVHNLAIWQLLSISFYQLHFIIFILSLSFYQFHFINFKYKNKLYANKNKGTSINDVRDFLGSSMSSLLPSLKEQVSCHCRENCKGDKPTVVCIKVRTASFPRFWKNHPKCRKK